MKNEKIEISCSHCGDQCSDLSLVLNDKYFCCNGCLSIYKLLNESGLAEVYSDVKPNLKIKANQTSKNYDYLNDAEIESKLIDFKNKDYARIRLRLPSIHCSSCVWLLERLNIINPAIINSRVDFLMKTAVIEYDTSKIKLSEIADLLSNIGYKPNFNLADTDGKKTNEIYKKLYLKLGIAFFCFGNMMLLALPEYFAGSENLESGIKDFLRYLNLAFVPPLLFTASDYFKSAYSGIKAKSINLDIPLSLGIIAFVIRSVFDILYADGQGYIDSFAGLMFFLTLGKIFRYKTFDTISFDNSLKNYFPLSATILENSTEKSIAVSKIKPNDNLIIRNSEIVPLDCLLISDTAHLDYAFITGESTPIQLSKGEIVYAGSKNRAGNIEAKAIKTFDDNYISSLWNSNQNSQKGDIVANIDKVAKYFTWIILIICTITIAYFLMTDYDLQYILEIVTSVLIISCPCALAMASPFSYGTALRALAKRGLFVKNDFIVENIAKTDTIIFDKTGTLSYPDKTKTKWVGEQLSENDVNLLKSAFTNSTHPLSKVILDFIGGQVKLLKIESFEQIDGKGFIAKIGDTNLIVGSKSFVLGLNEELDDVLLKQTQVHLKIDNSYKGHFNLKSKFRENIKDAINNIKQEKLIISGDNSSDSKELKEMLGDTIEMHFKVEPRQKAEIIKNLNKLGRNTMMVGDGLNDTLALQVAKVGVAVAENKSSFTPAADAILDSEKIAQFPKFITISQFAVKVVKLAIILSFLYNVIGISFAITGNLSPVVAAILMPLSSISVIILTSMSIKLKDRLMGV